MLTTVLAHVTSADLQEHVVVGVVVGAVAAAVSFLVTRRVFRSR